MTFRTEAMYNERKSEQLLAAMPVTGLTLSADSLYNPFGQDLTSVNRRFIETGGRSFNQNVKIGTSMAAWKASLNLLDATSIGMLATATTSPMKTF